MRLRDAIILVQMRVIPCRIYRAMQFIFIVDSSYFDLYDVFTHKLSESLSGVFAFWLFSGVRDLHKLLNE